MSYLLAETSPDMIATECGPKPKPDPDTDDPNRFYGTLKGMPYRNGPGFIKLNTTENLRSLWRNGYIYDHPRVYASVCLTWKGWDRVEELIASGMSMPTEEEKADYARVARIVVEGGDHGDYIPLDVPNPGGLQPEPAQSTESRPWWRRLFRRASNA
jgi:hypothetical protein